MFSIFLKLDLGEWHVIKIHFSFFPSINMEVDYFPFLKVLWNFNDSSEPFEWCAFYLEK